MKENNGIKVTGTNEKEIFDYLIKFLSDDDKINFIVTRYGKEDIFIFLNGRKIKAEKDSRVIIVEDMPGKKYLKVITEKKEEKKELNDELKELERLLYKIYDKRMSPKDFKVLIDDFCNSSLIDGGKIKW